MVDLCTSDLLSFKYDKLGDFSIFDDEEQRKLLKFKDEVIWKMSEELKKKYDFY